MDWNSVIGDVITAVVPILVAALALGVKVGVNWMRHNKNAVVQNIGELAYNEIENNFAGAEGAEKLQRAIAAARQRIGDNPLLKNVTDEALAAAIQKAWEQNEGQHK